MKYLKIAFGLVMVAGMMAVATSSAMAAPKWVTCLNVGVNKGKWTNSTCSKPGTGEWETSEVAATIETTSSGTLKLEDSEATGGAVQIECTGGGTGTVGAGGSDSIKTITAEKCKFIKNGACEASKEVTAFAVNLGWSTKLKEENGEVRDEITSLVSGKKPGWSVKCHVAGIFEITDTCEANATTKIKSPAETTNAGTLEAVFDTKSGNAKCSAGGAESGHVLGTVVSSTRVGGALRALWVLANITGFPS
jgi:hypothetical protein